MGISNREKDSLLNIDYINKDYKFLGSEFQINSEALNQKNLNIKFKENASYKDSLRTILEYNLKNDYAVHLAYHRILTPWERTSFYLWKSVEETQKIARSFGFDHPYLFYQFLISEEKNGRKDELISNLYESLKKNLEIEKVFETNKALLRFAFKKNPARAQAMKDYVRKKI